MQFKIFIFALLAGVLISVSAPAQFVGSSQVSEIGLPYFQMRSFSTFDPQTGDRLARIYVQISNENITFLKSDSGYEAELQIEVFVNGRDEETAFSRSINRRVHVENYEATTSPTGLNTFFTDLPVKPGKYEVIVTVSDKNNNNQFTRQGKMEIAPDPAAATREVLLSDVLFFSRFTTDDKGRITQFHPTLENRFASDKDYIYAYFTTFSPDENSQAEIKYVVKDENGIIAQQNQYTTPAGKKFLEHFVRLSRYYLNQNNYTMELVVHRNDQWIVRNTAFSFFWRFAPTTQQDLDLAIRQLKYIAKDDSIKRYQNAPFEEKQAFFKRFWQTRDPDPSTEHNELMEEYYRRINFANANFSATGVGGWITDRGRIYIKFGEPDEIERHPFEAETYPYQIWRYYTLQKVFLFIDRTGFGDYDLHPSYYYVEFE